MKNIITIARREILSFFVSPIAYFVITGFILLGGYFFFNLLGIYNLVLARYKMTPYGQMPDYMNLNEYVIEQFYYTLLVILVFLVPMLTMRTIAEEKKRGTFELLVTSPVKVAEIVWGKFIGVAVVLTVMLLAVFCFPLFLWTFGDPEVKPIISGFFAVLACALGFASIGMAVSSFTENQVVAAVSSMVVLLLLYVIHSPAESLGGAAQSVLEYLSPVLQARDMIHGVVALHGIVYFGSLIWLGLFLSQRALDAQRWR